MSNHNGLKEFFDKLLTNAVEEHESTREYVLLTKQRESINMAFRDNLTADQKELVEECLLEIDAGAERKTQLAYRQGLTDCVWILKELGVLS